MVKRISLSVALLIISLASFSQRILTREQYIQKYAPLAISEMQRSGIPASITLAQACLESNNGNSELSILSNNHFGIKCKSTWQGERTYYDDDRKNECFRNYNSPEESFVDHTNFLMNNPRYGNLFELKLTDFKGWAHGLKKDGYATNTHYATRLIKIIEDYKLYLYDEGLDRSQIARIQQQSNQGVDTRTLINPYRSRKVVLRNGLKTIVVQKGDTFEKIAQEFGLKDWEIYTYNDYNKGRQPQENEILYIEPKHRKADRAHRTHRVEAGESMHFISQRYGIKLKRLYRLNRMRQGEVPTVGEVIYLRHKKPRR